MASYLSGDTIRLLCTFKDFAGNLADPTLINVKIYDQTYTLISTNSVDLVNNKTSSGNYFYDYTCPAQYQNKTLYYEWYAEYNGVPSLNRGSFQIVFIGS
jgi:hypothetical protein